MSIADEIYNAARERFEATAGMDAPHLPTDPFESLQTRLYRWQVNAFGSQPAERQVLGIVEEFGEWWDSDSDEGELDAIGDIAVYTTQLCTTLRLDAGLLLGMRPWPWESDASAELTPDAISIVGQLSHVCLKTMQGIRGMSDPEKSRRAYAESIFRIGLWLNRRSRLASRTLFDILSGVAEEVMQRVPAKLPQVAR